MADSLPTFSANLRQARLQQGLSQERLAHRAGLNMTHVARIELGDRAHAGLAKGLNISAAVLFEGIDGRDS